MTFSLWPCHPGVSSSSWDTSQVRTPTLWTHLTLITSLKAPCPKFLALEARAPIPPVMPRLLFCQSYTSWCTDIDVMLTYLCSFPECLLWLHLHSPLLPVFHSPAQFLSLSPRQSQMGFTPPLKVISASLKLPNALHASYAWNVSPSTFAPWPTFVLQLSVPILSPLFNCTV